MSTDTASFLAVLRTAPDLPLEFRLGGVRLVPEGYHVTEIKAVSIRSVDCGGVAHQWQETVVQLIDGTPAEARHGDLTTGKFLAIYERVAATLRVEGTAELRFEYGNLTRPALHYHLKAVEVQAGRVVAELSLPGVICKASGASSLTGVCCEPSAAELIQLG